jgi:hypothetical protein
LLLKVLVRWKVLSLEKHLLMLLVFEAIMILFAFAASKGFKLYQIDMKSTFLNGVIQEEVFFR